MKDLISLTIFFSIYFTSVVLLASRNLREKYSDERSNVIFNSIGSWSLNKNMFNEKEKQYYLISNSFGILWIGYIIIILIFNSF